MATSYARDQDHEYVREYYAIHQRLPSDYPYSDDDGSVNTAEDERQYQSYLRDQHYYSDEEDDDFPDVVDETPARDWLVDYLPTCELYRLIEAGTEYYEEHIRYHFGRRPYEEIVRIDVPTLVYVLARQEPEENSQKRQLRRMKKLKEELLTVTLHPNRIKQCGLGELF